MHVNGTTRVRTKITIGVSPGGANETRTRDPLLANYNQAVAETGWTWLNVPSTWDDLRSTQPGVAMCLAMLAPRLAPVSRLAGPAGDRAGCGVSGWLEPSRGGGGIAHRKPDRPVAEIGHEVQPAAESFHIAGNNLERADLTVLYL